MSKQNETKLNETKWNEMVRADSFVSLQNTFGLPNKKVFSTTTNNNSSKNNNNNNNTSHSGSLSGNYLPF